MRRVVWCSWWIGLLALGACEDLSDFQGTYEGAIIDGNFVRRCFAAGTTATLEFDAEAAVIADEPPEVLNTLTTSDGTFEGTALVPFAALPHDQLSLFDFPGPSRLKNFLLLARPSAGPLAGRDAFVVVSLLKQGSVEVRVMARSDDAAEVCVSTDVDNLGAADGHEYFGVFQMKE